MAGARFDDGERLRKQVFVDQKSLAFAASGAIQKRHRFGRGRRLVQQRGVGDRQGGQIGDHRLEIQQHLQAPLRDLGLIRRVGGVKARIFQHAADDDRRHARAVISHPNHIDAFLIGFGEGAQVV